MAQFQVAYLYAQSVSLPVRSASQIPSVSVAPSDSRTPAYRRRRRRRVYSVPHRRLTRTNASTSVHATPPPPSSPPPSSTSSSSAHSALPLLPSIYFTPTAMAPSTPTSSTKSRLLHSYRGTSQFRTSTLKSPTFSYNMTLKILARKKNSLSTCLGIVDEMRCAGIRPDKYTYSALLTSCIRSKARTTAIELYHQIRKDGVQLDHYLRANLLKIAASGPSPQIDLCLRLFQGDPHPNLVMCNVMMDAYANTASLDKCISTYRYMIGAGVLPDAYTVSALVKAYIRSGRLDDAVTNLREIYKSGLDVPSVVFSQLIDAFGKRGFMDRAVELYDMMTAWHIEPSQITFNVLIGACAHSGNLPRAIEIFEEMKHTTSFSGDRYTYHALMKCCLRCGDGNAALDWYHAIKTTPFQCNQVSYRYALLASGQSFNLDAVYRVANDMEEGGVPPREDTVATAIAACIRCSDLQGASVFLRSHVQNLRVKNVDQRPQLSTFFNHIRTSLEQLDPNDDVDAPDYLGTTTVVDEMERTWNLESK